MYFDLHSMGQLMPKKNPNSEYIAFTIPPKFFLGLVEVKEMFMCIFHTSKTSTNSHVILMIP